MPHFRSVAALAVLVLYPALAAAQNITSPYEYIETRHQVGVFGGYLETNTGSLDVGPRPAPLFGVRYGLNMTGPLYGDVEIGVAPSKRTVYARTSNEPGAALSPLGDANLILLSLMGDLRFQVTGARTWNGFAPYVVAGGGIVTNLSPRSNREDVLTQDQLFRFGPTFAASGGLGIDFFATERISFRLDFRDHLWRLSLPVGLTGSAERQGEWQHNFGLTLGSAIHF